MATPPDNIGVLEQIIIGVVGLAVAAVAHLLGARAQPTAANASNGNLIIAENDKLRRDLEEILRIHREALDVRIENEMNKFRADIHQIEQILREDLEKRLRAVELAEARREGREQR